MSQKIGNAKGRSRLIGLLLLIFTLSSMACDPCRELAEQVCQCRTTEEERRQCIESLSLAKQHKYFDTAQKPEICKRGLEKCSCTAINDHQDQKCGMYRLAIE